MSERFTAEELAELRALYQEANESDNLGALIRMADTIPALVDEIERLRRERDEAKHDVHRAQLWIASLIHLHGGQVRIPFSVLTEVARTFTRSTDPETGDEILALLDGEKGGDGA